MKISHFSSKSSRYSLILLVSFQENSEHDFNLLRKDTKRSYKKLQKLKCLFKKRDEECEWMNASIKTKKKFTIYRRFWCCIHFSCRHFHRKKCEGVGTRKIIFPMKCLLWMFFFFVFCVSLVIFPYQFNSFFFFFFFLFLCCKEAYELWDKKVTNKKYHMKMIRV